MELIHQIDIQSDTTFTDTVPQDGSYDYLISAMDEAGLTANSNLVSIPHEVFFPKPIQLLSVNVNADTVSLSWTENSDIDFELYRIEQGTDSGDFVGILDIHDQITTTAKFNVIQYNDYNYRISCVDSALLESHSNVLNVDKELFLPSQIELESLTLLGDQISLNWNYTTDSDFLKFQILRNDATVSEIYNSDIRNFSDIVTQGFDYTYKVKVVDGALLESISNEKSIYSDEFYPPPVEISNISYDGTGILIQWTPSDIPDFQKIDVLRSSDSLFTDADLINTIQNQNESMYYDTDLLTSYVRYFYRLRLVDSAELSTESIKFSYYTFFKHIAFISDVGGTRQLFSVESDEYNINQLTNVSDDVYNPPSWSPDGKNIVFDTHYSGIYITNLESETTRFLNNGTDPKWSPEGLKIAFVDNKQIYTIDASGGSPSQLTELEASEIDWSPNGQKLALRSFEAQYQIYTINVDGSGLTNISRESTIQDTGPLWSPDGTKILYVTTVDDDAEIFVVNSEGTNHLNLTNTIGPDYDPNWSPDGSNICFRSYRDGGSNQIYIMNSDGTSPQNLSNNSAVEIHPSFSNDSEKLVFTSNIDGIENEIYVMNKDGSNRYRLINSERENWMRYPRWEP